MPHQIISQVQNFGKFIVRIVLNDGSSSFLYFNYSPTADQIEIEAQKLENSLQNVNLSQPLPDIIKENVNMGYLMELRAELQNVSYQGLSNEDAVARLNIKSTGNTAVPMHLVITVLAMYGAYSKIYDAVNDINNKDHAFSVVARDTFLNPSIQTLDFSLPTVQGMIDAFSTDILSNNLKMILKSMTSELQSRAEILFGHDVIIDDVIAAKLIGV